MTASRGSAAKRAAPWRTGAAARRLGTTLLSVAVGLAGCAEPPRQPGSAGSRSPESTLSPMSSEPTPPPTARRSSSSSDAGPTSETLIAAGDIAACDEEGDSATGTLVASMDGTVATLGDNVYPAGSVEAYAQCYAPVWGSFLDRTRPTMGNHDAQDDGGAAYFEYFGDAAGRPGEGWYSYALGAWHVVALNSNCGLVGCGPGSAQLAWLVEDLAASGARCTLAYWHHPLFSSGPRGGFADVAPLWQALEASGAELVLVGHDHLYERFAPQTSDGSADSGGLRQFIVGTGGKELYRRTGAAPNSELAIDDSFGVLELTLRPSGYGWSFLTTDGREADRGSGACR